MLATVPSNNTLKELELDGYCDFGFPVASNAAAWEFGNLAADATLSLPRASRKQLETELPLPSIKLDEAIREFAKVFLTDGSRDIDTAQLLKALHAHIKLLKLGGAALCLVVKDLESNLRKVETLLRKSPKECETLASLLRHERDSDIHDGNRLHGPSAAMGLLWIRRLLAFQMVLFGSLTPSARGLQPKDAAYEAYEMHLSRYHGWMLRTVVPAAFSQFPGRAVLLSQFGEVEIEEMDREHEYEISKKWGVFVSILERLVDEWEDCFERLDLEDTRRV